MAILIPCQNKQIKKRKRPLERSPQKIKKICQIVFQNLAAERPKNPLRNSETLQQK